MIEVEPIPGTIAIMGRSAVIPRTYVEDNYKGDLEATLAAKSGQFDMYGAITDQFNYIDGELKKALPILMVAIAAYMFPPLRTSPIGMAFLLVMWFIIKADSTEALSFEVTSPEIAILSMNYLTILSSFFQNIPTFYTPKISLVFSPLANHYTAKNNDVTMIILNLSVTITTVVFDCLDALDTVPHFLAFYIVATIVFYIQLNPFYSRRRILELYADFRNMEITRANVIAAWLPMQAMIVEKSAGMFIPIRFISTKTPLYIRIFGPRDYVKKIKAYPAARRRDVKNMRGTIFFEGEYQVLLPHLRKLQMDEINALYVIGKTCCTRQPLDLYWLLDCSYSGTKFKSLQDYIRELLTNKNLQIDLF